MHAMIFDLLQPEVRPSSEGEAELRFASQEQFRIPGGGMQGGIVTSMLDMAMAFACDGAMSSASIQVEIHRPVTADYVNVKARITKRGSRIVFAEATMTDDAGTVLARGTQTAVPLD